MSRKLLFQFAFLKKEVPQIRSTVMSMFFRSRPPRKLRRKIRVEARHRAPAPRLDLFGSSPLAVPIPVQDSPRRRRQRAMGYITGRPRQPRFRVRSEEHTSELQSLMRITYAVFCLKKKN